MPSWTLTPNLRWHCHVFKDPAGDTSGVTYIPRYGPEVLQQLWVDEEGNQEWREVQHIAEPIPEKPKKKPSAKAATKAMREEMKVTEDMLKRRSTI